MRTTDRTLSKGDTLELGDVVESTVEQTRGGGLRFTAVHEGEPTEYVILTARFTDGEEIAVPDDGQVLAVTDGTGMSNPTAWLLVPRDAYGGSDE